MAWFPITDPAREDDIRMRRRRAAMLLACIVFLPWIAFGGQSERNASRHDHGSGLVVGIETSDAQRIAAAIGAAFGDRASAGRAQSALAQPAADAPQRAIVAHALRIDLPCAASVTILSDPAYDGRAVVYAAKDDAQALDTLSLGDGTIAQDRTCGADADLIVRTGPATPLTLVQSGSNDLHAGGFDAPVTVESDGSGDVVVDRSGPLTVRQHASGDVSVGTVAGPITAMLLGSGDLTVHEGEAPVLDATSAASGDVVLGRTRIGGGKVTLEGSGDFSAEAVNGSFQALTVASGDVSIGTATVDRLTLDGRGSGDIVVRHGSIATLQATRRGSGDLQIGASVTAGRLDHDGSGDVDVPRSPGLIRTGD